MKIALVSGSWPPDPCGVADYCACLATALEAHGLDILRLPKGAQCPSTLAARRFAADAQREGADIIHIQYPTMGYGRSLFPASLALASPLPVVVTLHEFSIFRAYRLPWFLPFATHAHTVVLTSQAEQASFRRRLPVGRARSMIVPIGSNIGRGRAGSRDPRAICSFGLIMPGKDIEAFLDLAMRLRDGGQAWRVHLIGGVPDHARVYAAKILAQAAELGIITHVGLPPHEVADLLSAMSFAYLPFPGGATERRGSLLAALTNDVQVLTSVGQDTPDWLRRRVTVAHSAEAASHLLQSNPPTVAPGGMGEDRFDWPAIAARHATIYREAIADGRRTRNA